MENINLFSEYKNLFVLAHVVAVICGMGAALTADAIFSFYGKDKILTPEEVKKLSKFSNIVWISLATIILTGVAIFLSNPEFYMSSAKFLSKMSVVGVITLNGFVLYRFIQPRLSMPNFLTSPLEKGRRKLAFACGAISLISWFSALILALLNSLPFSYLTAMTIYLFVMIIGVSISQLMENKISHD